MVVGQISLCASFSGADHDRSLGSCMRERGRCHPSLSTAQGTKTWSPHLRNLRSHVK